MKHLLGVSMAVILGGVAAAPASAADGPPVAQPRPVVDEYFGTKVTDPYRYFENLSDPEVKAWVKGQAEYAHRVLSAIPGRDALLERIRELDEGAPYRLSVVRRWPNGDLHYLKRLSTENLDKLYFRDAKTGHERLLVDPELLHTADGKHFSLAFVRPSPDGRYVAYGLAAAGSEQTVLHVLDSTSGKNLPDTIDRMEEAYLEPCWLPDGQSFVYSRRRKLPADAPDTESYQRTYSCLHHLGTDPEQDARIFSMEVSPTTPMSAVDFPAVAVFPGSAFAIGQIKHGDTNELTLYAAPVESLTQKHVPWKMICDVADEVEGFAVRGGEIYLLTAKDSPRYKVVRTSLAEPGFSAAPTVIPMGTAVIKSIAIAKDALYCALLEGGAFKAARLPLAAGAKLETIELPAGAASGYPFATNPEIDGALVGTASWTRGGKIYSFDPGKRALTETDLRPPGKFDDVPGYEVAEVQVVSHDGVRVPLSILYKSGIKLDGSHPTLVDGYGAYGMSMSAHFDPAHLAWLERGGVLAFAHVRGGGDFGKEWHLAGRKSTKPNTWKDFIACCEYLVKAGYTSPAKLAGEGGSAGGVLIGRSITERPDLFAAAIINVGLSDALRMETTANGVPNIQEFGTVKTREGFDGLFAMSAYAHVKDGEKYPAVLLTHGINDPRVEPWESAKMTARLQAATASGKPVLFRVDYDAGHGIGSTRKQRQEERADEWAFLLWQMGDTYR
jgi:prolyl oligopeptidase